MSVDDINELVRWRDKADELATLLERYSIELQQMRAEVATKTIERDEAWKEVERWKAQHLESQHNGAREAIARKSAEAEVERLKVERDEARGDAEQLLKDLLRCASEPYEAIPARQAAFRRGAEAMREACAQRLEANPQFVEGFRAYLANEIRDLPIPEDKP